MLCALTALALVASPATAAPPGWPQFRGPAGTGVADDQTPPIQIGPDRNVRWKVPVPPGFSSPVVAGGRLFLTAFDGGKLFTIAYDLADGKELWRKAAQADKIEAYHKTEGSPAASTVATDGDRVVAYFGSCGLVCYDLSGNEVWAHAMPCAVTNNDFGSGTSPVIADGKVVLLRDTLTDSKLIALDLKTGKPAWEARRSGGHTSWGSPCTWDVPGGKQVVVPGAKNLTAYDLATGAEVWTVSGLCAVPCTTPVVADGKLIFAGWSPGGADFKMPAFDEVLEQAGEKEKGYLTKEGSEKTFLKGFFDNNDADKDGKITRGEWDEQVKFMKSGKNVAVAVRPGGAGDVTRTHVAWRVEKGLPYVPSPLVYRGVMYTANMQGRVSAYDAGTGAEVYSLESVGLNGVYASPVGANGHVYFFGLDRSVVVLEAGEFPKKVWAAKLDDRIAATPAIAGNTLYVRTGKTLFAFGAK